MQLTSTKRVMLVLFGLGMIATGVFCAARGWSVAAVPLVTLGGVVVVGAIIGQVPSGNIKELQLQWRDQELHDRVDRLELALGELREETEAGVSSVRQAAVEISVRFDDYLLAMEHEPVDGHSDGEERLQEWESGLDSLDYQIASRRFTGEDYDDGIGIDELIEARDKLARKLDRERHRQEAQRKYGHLRNA